MINNHDERAEQYIGIDLGTTNSVIAQVNTDIRNNLRIKVIDLPMTVSRGWTFGGKPILKKVNEKLIPSCVYYKEDNNYFPIVGGYAKEEYRVKPFLVAKSIKSQMGREKVEGLSENVIDKTPAEVASRIIKFMIDGASKKNGKEINEAIITVPANFDSIMCKSTLDAAEIAGIKVKNEDGTYKHILLTEPNAVIYDFITQMKSGDISSDLLNLDESKRVIVFDLGGGTLDITMHEILKKDKYSDIVKITELSSNRYTLLGGDNFDRMIANEMFRRYLKQYKDYPEVVNEIKDKENEVMPILIGYAEELKISLSMAVSDGMDMDKNFDTGGGMNTVQYAYDDSFTKDEIEEILLPLMGNQLKFYDYKKIGSITQSADKFNIIYPILDVLRKASDKTGEDNIKVDAVILNGGMSRFYMVIDRLKKFFGFDPIVVLDPDLSVARGAAIYNYLVHKDKNLEDDMVSMLVNPTLNDNLYIGVKSMINGIITKSVHMIIPAGKELPINDPKVQKGFSISANQSYFDIPIKVQDINGEYREIAKGRIYLNEKYPNGAFVAFKVYMNENKILTMKAWTSYDEEGNDKIEECGTEISLDGTNKKEDVNEETNNDSSKDNKCDKEIDYRPLMNKLSELYDKKILYGNGSQKKNRIDFEIDNYINTILTATDKCGIAPYIISKLDSTANMKFKEKLFVIARKIGAEWPVEYKNKLAAQCIKQLKDDIGGRISTGIKVCVNMQAINALSMCGSENDFTILKQLHGVIKYLQPCLYAHGKSQTDIEWLYNEFLSDVKLKKRRSKSNIQQSAYALGISLRKDTNANIDFNQDVVVDSIINIIKTGLLYKEELVCCVLALGYICDQRGANKNSLDKICINSALTITKEISKWYTPSEYNTAQKSIDVSSKMIRGIELTKEEEDFLLKKLNMD